MAAFKKCFEISFGFLLLTAYFFKEFGAIESEMNQDKSKEVTSSIKVDSSDKIAPGEVVISLEGKTTGEVKSQDGEKKVEIKQSENGKTTEEEKAAENASPAGEMEKKPAREDEANEKKTEEGKESDEGDKKVDETKSEEVGLELRSLNDGSFEHLTQASTGATTGDWLVLFSKKDNCDQCIEVEKEMKIVHERIKHKLNVAKVEEGSLSKLTFKRFRIENLPVIFLFRHGKKFSFEGNKTVDELLKFVDGGFELMPWSVVRAPYTSFELFVEESVEELKHMVRYKKNVSLIIFIAGFLLGLSVTSICGSMLFHLLENFKDDDEFGPYSQEYSTVPETVKDKPE